MSFSRRRFLISTSASLCTPGLLLAQSGFRLETIAQGFDAPWAVGFVPQGQLVTERDGRLVFLPKDGSRREVAGLPAIREEGQGGLLDLLVPRNHKETRHVFMTYAKPQGRSAGTAVLRAEFDAQSVALKNVQTIFEMGKGSRGGRHFGSRLVEARDGRLFVSIGDRGKDQEAQNLGTHNGTILRITKDGQVPGDNPFVSIPGARKEIWSYGHRNPQGLALDLKGVLWAHEHGARGGDEINRISKGANYGWPVIAYGTEYSGAKIGEGTSKAGMQQPEHYWDPSIAPSGYMIYSGKLWPEWRGHHFVGSLKFDYISRLTGSPLREVAQIRSEATGRVRDIREAPDGSIWFLSVINGTLNRLAPV